jgi:type I restriction enzyme S subunit
MKKGWETKDLAAVSAINYGYTESASSEPVGPRFLRITDIQDDQVDWDNVPYCKIEKADLPKYRLASGDIVFARTGATTGKSFLVNEPPEAVFASYLIRLRLLDKKLLPEFVLLFFQTAGYWQSIKDGSSGSAQGGFNATKLGALTIPVPPLAEQVRIVGLLDEAFEGLATAKANAEKNLQNARALFESHLQSVFTQRGPGWVEKPLAELCDSSRVITYGVIKLGDETPNGVPCLRTSNVRWLHIDIEGMKRITPKLSAEYSRTILKGGEVLVNVRGTLGGVAVASPEMAGWNVSREVAVVPINSSRVNPAFLSYLIGSGTSQHWLGGVKKGAAYIGINIEDLRLLPVNAPKMEKQLEVVEHLDSLHEETQRLARIYERKLAALAELKKSLMHQAFTGEL